MINKYMLDVATVLITMFTYIDDFCKQQPLLNKSGPKPVMTDSEILTIVLFAELSGKTSEYEHVRYVEQWLKNFFPRMIDRSQYHRRVERLRETINYLRLKILDEKTLALSDTHIIDSTPVPIIAFCRANFSPLFSGEAAFGYCAAKRLHYYGFKLHLVTDSQGIPIHFELSTANISDSQTSEEILRMSSCGHLVLGDKGYLSKATQAHLKDKYDIELITPKRKNQKDRESKPEQRLHGSWRQIIEVVNGLFKEQFHVEKTFAKSLNGLVGRILNKITAFTFGIFMNRIFGRNTLEISSLIA